MKNAAIIVAGGSGQRMNTDIPKQFLLLAGRPVLMHTIERFHQFDSSIGIVVVLPKNQIDYWNELVEDYHFKIRHQIVVGGNTRFHSVKNGLHSLENINLVAIHDGVRPLVSVDCIKRTFKAAQTHGNAIPAIQEVNSVRIIKDRKTYPLRREDLRIIQTPQVFRFDLIIKAFETEYHHDFTDDASVLEQTGAIIHLVDGNKENIKITTPTDLLLAEAFLKV